MRRDKLSLAKLSLILHSHPEVNWSSCCFTPLPALADVSISGAGYSSRCVYGAAVLLQFHDPCDAECLFTCFIGHLYTFFGEVSVQTCSFSVGSFCCCCWFLARSWYVLDTIPLRYVSQAVLAFSFSWSSLLLPLLIIITLVFPAVIIDVPFHFILNLFGLPAMFHDVFFTV